MSDVRVIAAYEEYHKILQALSDDLKVYVSNMRESSSGVDSTVHALGNDWQGEAYDNFRAETVNILRDISASLDRVISLTDVIDDKVPKIAKAIELLKGNE